MKRPLPIANFQLPFVRMLVILLALLPLASCGYSTHPLYNAAYHTISVPIAENRSFRQGWEFHLTEALDKNIEFRTPYKIVGSQDKADTVLTCEIVDIQDNVLTRRPDTTIPRETQVTIIVNFTWKDRNGRLLVERKEFNRASTEIPQIGERVDDAIRLAVERLAAAIVDQMQTQW